MFAAIQYIAEERIRQAQETGAFDNLPGRGKPLNLEDDSAVPEDLRMAYKVLKNAGYAPENLPEGGAFATSRDLLPQDGGERKRLRQLQKLEILLAKADLAPARVESLYAREEYFDAVAARVPVRDTGEGR